jgi:putative transposase
MQKRSGSEVVTTVEAIESPLPAPIQEALGGLVGAAREGLLALSVGVGLGVVHELMALEVDEVVGPKGKHNPDRTAKRHGHEDGSMTVGGRRVAVRRPRVRTADDEHELPMQSYGYCADRDPLTRAVIDRMLAGVSTRRFAAVGEPVGDDVERSSSTTSRTSVSEMFIERTRTALGELMSPRLDDVRLAVMMLDGLEIADRTHIVALGITTDGVKIPLGLWEGSTENATLARTLLADLVDRGRDRDQAILFVIDGGKALRRAIQDVFGEHALVHRCHRHKQRNVTDLLPERDRDQVRSRMRAAWSLTDAELAEQRLELLACELDQTWPDAAGPVARGHGRHADADAPRDRRAAGQDAVLDEPLPVDDRDRPQPAAQRKALAGRRHAQALDRRRHARRRAAVPKDHRLQGARQARDRDRTSRDPRRRKGRGPSRGPRASYRLTVNPEDRRRSSTTIRTSSLLQQLDRFIVVAGLGANETGEEVVAQRLVLGVLRC